MEKSFLLICKPNNPPRLVLWCEVLSSLGTLQVIELEMVVETSLDARHDLIIIDTMVKVEPARLVSHLCTLQPAARILVIFTVPTWDEARDVLRAGAFDYLPIGLPEGEIVAAINEALDN